MSEESTFHAGELRVQERAGELDRGRRNGRVVGAAIPSGARPWLALQTFAVLAAREPDGAPRAWVVPGEPGFLSAADEGRALDLDLARAFAHDRDELARALAPGAEVGLIALDAAERRRLRVNGRVARADGALLRVAVDRSYPNCPKYIRRRRLSALAPRAALGPLEVGGALDAERRALVGRADTLFVASAHAERGLDASHRGGPPGFARAEPDGRALSVPDYAGNGMFNTLGNVELDPRCSLAFLDHERSRVLVVRARAGLAWDVADAEEWTGATGRAWRAEVLGWREAPLAAELSWALLDPFPVDPREG